ncbi:MAG: DUF2330 domain-containing protein [Myxococcota bacterium]|nr:DUF2330 domain-containing protein [Myxococcota bacterium]
MKTTKFYVVAAVFAVLFSCQSAWALGTLITTDGTTITASRTLVVRHADSLQLVTQVKYGLPAENFIWLVAIPNFNRPEDEGVSATIFPNSALNELDELSRPRLQAVCDGDGPTGAVWEWIQGDGFGPGLDMRPAISYYTAAEITAGELNEFVTGQGYQINAETQTMIDDIVNKNMMLVAARVNVADLGVPRIDPIISISYPAARDDRQGLALQTLIPNLNGGLADVVVYVLNTDRTKMISRTVPLNFDSVEFLNDNETNYIEQMDAQLGVHQTRMTVVEYAGNLDPTTLNDMALKTAISESGSSFLTRLHTRISPAALRAETQAQGIIALRTEPTGDYTRDHQVSHSICESTADPDSGADNSDTDGGIAGSDGSIDDADANILALADGGVEGESGSGGGSGGCTMSGSDSSLPLSLLIILLALYPINTRRTRR